jgi:hypothetical protein
VGDGCRHRGRGIHRLDHQSDAAEQEERRPVAVARAHSATGPATLPELAEALNMTGLLAKGKVVMALQEMTSKGRIEVLDAPQGTPQLEKVKFIKYKLKDSAT